MAGGWGNGGYTLYTSNQAHSSIQKAARLAGLGDDALRLVEVDDATLAMRPESLRALIATDLAADRVPALVVATIGTTLHHRRRPGAGRACAPCVVGDFGLGWPRDTNMGGRTVAGSRTAGHPRSNALIR